MASAGGTAQAVAAADKQQQTQAGVITVTSSSVGTGMGVRVIGGAFTRLVAQWQAELRGCGARLPRELVTLTLAYVTPLVMITPAAVALVPKPPTVNPVTGQVVFDAPNKSTGAGAAGAAAVGAAVGVGIGDDGATALTRVCDIVHEHILPLSRDLSHGSTHGYGNFWLNGLKTPLPAQFVPYSVRVPQLPVHGWYLNTVNTIQYGIPEALEPEQRGIKRVACARWLQLWRTLTLDRSTAAPAPIRSCFLSAIPLRLVQSAIKYPEHWTSDPPRASANVFDPIHDAPDPQKAYDAWRVHTRDTWLHAQSTSSLSRYRNVARESRASRRADNALADSLGAYAFAERLFQLWTQLAGLLPASPAPPPRHPNNIITSPISSPRIEYWAYAPHVLDPATLEAANRHGESYATLRIRFVPPLPRSADPVRQDGMMSRRRKIMACAPGREPYQTDTNGGVEWLRFDFQCSTYTDWT